MRPHQVFVLLQGVHVQRTRRRVQLHELVARFDTDTVSRERDVQMCVVAPLHVHWFGSNAKEHHVHGKREDGNHVGWTEWWTTRQ